MIFLQNLREVGNAGMGIYNKSRVLRISEMVACVVEMVATAT